MNKIYLVTRPEHDDTTYYLSKWSKESINMAEEHNIKILDLQGKKANKKEVESRLRKFSPQLVVFNGHGDENTVSGHKNQPVIIAGDNESVLKEKMVFAISCRSAKNLGPMSVKKGAVCYAGYMDDFIFFYDPEHITRPLADKTARLFLEPQQKFIESLLKGNTIDESLTRTKKAMMDNMTQLLASDSGDAYLAKYLWWNVKNLVAHGDKNAAF